MKSKNLRTWERLGRDMPKPFDRAFDEVETFVSTVLPDAVVQRVGTEDVAIENTGKRAIVRFGTALLEDFESTLEHALPIRYSNGIKSDVHFSVYVALAAEGMIPEIKLSELLINDEREWLARCRLDTAFHPEFAKGLYGGLTSLQSSLADTLEAGVDLPEVKADLQIIGDLVAWYGSTQSLNTIGAELTSLSFLKAAALCWMLDLEEKKTKELRPRVKAALDRKIYELFAWTQSTPYKLVKLPTAVFDFVADRKAIWTQSVGKSNSAARSGIEFQLVRLDQRLADRWAGAKSALHSDNPDRVSQAANSMVETLDQVIDRVRGTKEFKDYLADRLPMQTGVVLAMRKLITEVKDSLHRVKHHTSEQPLQLAEDLMKAAESIIHMLLR